MELLIGTLIVQLVLGFGVAATKPVAFNPEPTTTIEVPAENNSDTKPVDKKD